MFEHLGKVYEDSDCNIEISVAHWLKRVWPLKLDLPLATVVAVQTYPSTRARYGIISETAKHMQSLARWMSMKDFVAGDVVEMIWYNAVFSYYGCPSFGLVIVSL